MLENENLDSTEFNNPNFIKGLADILNERSVSRASSNKKKHLKRIKNKRNRLNKTSVNIEDISDNEQEIAQNKNSGRLKNGGRILKEEIIAKSH